jgi:hypothetical protein
LESFRIFAPFAPDRQQALRSRITTSARYTALLQWFPRNGHHRSVMTERLARFFLKEHSTDNSNA